MFNRQKTLAHQLLVKLQGQLLASQPVVNTLLDGFANIDNIYKPTIKSAVHLLKTNLENIQSKWSLLPLLGDALKWLKGTATTRDIWEIKQCVNQLIQAQSKQQETLVHVISILNITRYAAQVNRQKLNQVMDALQRSNEDLDRVFNIKEMLMQCIRYQQMYMYKWIILAYLRDSLIWGKLPYTWWTMWMQPPPMCCHLTYSKWKIWEICWDT